MKILAVHTQSHDTSVALIEDGKILYAAGNERFSRRKFDRATPVESLKNCLEYTKTEPSQIDHLVFVGNPFPEALLGRIKELGWPVAYTKGEFLLWFKNPLRILKEIAIASGVPSYVYRELISQEIIKLNLDGFEGNISYIHHHKAHLYSAYYTSGWKKCLVACIEGSGFNETVSVYLVDNDKWEKLTESRLPHSAGKFYELVTVILGFNPLKHGGKITGLAAFGNPKPAYHIVKRLMWIEGLELKLDWYTYLKWRTNYEVNKESPKELTKFNREEIAAAFQKRLEDCISDIIARCARATGESKIALSGGVVANVRMNQKIHELPQISEIHIHQAMGDSGVALGAALKVANEKGFKTGKLENVFFGPDFRQKEIVAALKKYNLKFEKPKNLPKTVAKLLVQNKIVARFDGRMEYGPRALGNRSILYSTTDKSVNDWLNKKLKRTEFMPFAPVTLERFAKKCYYNVKGGEYPARFMAITFNCTPYMKKLSPAVVHIDNTARPQIISKRDNPGYYKILEEYYKLTKIPSLVNTSFNMHEEPIVCSPGDACRAFIASGIDYLAIGNYLASSNE